MTAGSKQLQQSRLLDSSARFGTKTELTPYNMTALTRVTGVHEEVVGDVLLKDWKHPEITCTAGVCVWPELPFRVSGVLEVGTKVLLPSCIPP